MGALAGRLSTSAGARSAGHHNRDEYRKYLSGVASVGGCGACRIASSRHRSAQRAGSAFCSQLSPQRDGRCKLGPASSRWFSRGRQSQPHQPPPRSWRCGAIIGIWVYLDVIERHFTDAFQAFEKDVGNDDAAHLEQLAGRVALRVLAGQTEAAKSMGEEALPLLESRLREWPDDAFALTRLSWVYLALGRNADALRFSRQAADSTPIEKDALVGPYFQNGLAQIEARAGAPEEAIKRLRRLLSIPSGEAVSIARLKIDPVWDPIRNRPDFQQLLSGPEQIGPGR